MLASAQQANVIGGQRHHDILAEWLWESLFNPILLIAPNTDSRPSFRHKFWQPCTHYNIHPSIFLTACWSQGHTGLEPIIAVSWWKAGCALDRSSGHQGAKAERQTTTHTTTPPASFKSPVNLACMPSDQREKSELEIQTQHLLPNLCIIELTKILINIFKKCLLL